MLENISAALMMTALGIMVLSIVTSEAVMFSAEIMLVGVGMFGLSLAGFFIDYLVNER